MRIQLASILLIAGMPVARAQNWHQAPSELATKWSKEVTPSNALPEYPRPQMVREKEAGEWINLNGLWEYAITDSTSQHPGNFDGQILVPYPLESSLSGVKTILQPNQKLWYHRNIDLNVKQTNKRYLLHLGAVDFRCTAWVNGKPAGHHTGGYQAFSFDITDALQEGKNELIITVLDPTDHGNNPRGKQVLDPKGIMYTPTSGIWQTVWLEAVPTTYIEKLVLTPNVDEGYLSITTRCVNSDSAEYTVEAICNDQIINGKINQELRLNIPNAHLWSPNDPYLYNLSVRLLKNGKTIDQVRSYFGMRKIEIKKDNQGQERIFLNNQYTFNLGVLDQGFWPDGLYTAPTDEALKYDIQVIKDMGFNTIRKHIKIEPDRWYYHCDKLGILVWQDMPFPANLSVEAKAEYEAENNENIKQLYNHPCIVCWVLFNEGWNKYDQERLTKWLKKTDPTRIINGHSGENYDRTSPVNLNDKWINSDLTDIHVYPGPGIAPYLPGKARVLGEWGGIRVITPQHQWDSSKGWGYAESTATEFARKYEFMIKHLKLFEEEGLSGSIYTQPFDVETEENGLITYDREIFKIPKEKIKSINSLLIH